MSCNLEGCKASQHVSHSGWYNFEWLFEIKKCYLQKQVKVVAPGRVAYIENIKNGDEKHCSIIDVYFG